MGLSRKFEIEKLQNQDERKFINTIWPSNSGEWTDLSREGLHCYTRFEPIRYPSFTLLSSSREFNAASTQIVLFLILHPALKTFVRLRVHQSK